MLSDFLVIGSLAIPFALTFLARWGLTVVGPLGVVAGLTIWVIGRAAGAFETEEGTGEELALALGVPLYVVSWLAVALAAYGARVLFDRRGRTT